MQKIGLMRFQSAMAASFASLKDEENAFLRSIDPDGEFVFVEPDQDYPTLFFVQTGGSEIYFKEIYQNCPEPYLLLVAGSRNSLAAALEILSFLHRQGKVGHILQGEPSSIKEKLLQYSRFFYVNQKLRKTRLGVIGEPSDWLIASGVDPIRLQAKFGIQLITVSNEDFLDAVERKHQYPQDLFDRFSNKTFRHNDLQESLYVYEALKEICEDKELDGFTLRCFDLVNQKKQTSCLAFGMLNDEGIVAGCEGDVPSLLTMYFCKILLGQPSFMANPARIYLEKKEVIYAHCTCPFAMTTSYTLNTHFESGLGFGIKGELKESKVTAIKLAPDLDRVRLMTGNIVQNLSEPNLCRTQIKVIFDEPIDELLTDPYGNHMIFVYGDHKKEFQDIFTYLG